MPSTEESSKNWWSVLSPVIIVVLSAITIGLAMEVRALAPQARALQRGKVMPVPGMFVPTVRAATTAGDSITVGETKAGRSQVLIYFATTCQYCRETLPAWTRISRALLADSLRRFDVVWVSMSPRDSTRTYLAEHGITFPVVHMPHWKINRLLRVNGVPMTVVADHNGRVIHVHPSVFHNAAEEDSIMSAATAAASSAGAAAPADPSAPR